MSNDKFKFCPICGSGDVYVGATQIECGYDENCANYTKKQATVVNALLKSRNSRVTIDFSWEEEEEIETNPYFPSPNFGGLVSEED